MPCSWLCFGYCRVIIVVSILFRHSTASLFWCWRPPANLVRGQQSTLMWFVAYRAIDHIHRALMWQGPKYTDWLGRVLGLSGREVTINDSES